MSQQANNVTAGPAMSALTPEQIQVGRRLIEGAQESWRNPLVKVDGWRAIQADLSTWLFTHAADLVAAAESVDSLRAQLAARQKELDRQEELEAENCPEDQSWLQTLQAARRERDEALERLEIEQGEVSALNESRNRLQVQLTAREAEITHLNLGLQDAKTLVDALKQELAALTPSQPPQTTETAND